MILKDGRGQVHDLGPRLTFRPSMLSIAAGYGEEATGGWRSHAFLFTRSRPSISAEQQATHRREYNRQHRLDNIEHYRALERARSARRKDRAG